MPDLNPAQREAVETLSGPVLVLAGAGTGKTRVITYRIARLIKSGIMPSRILAVTFTNKAAKEMRERAQALLGKRKRGQKPPEISTFHSLCVRILRRHANRLGYPSAFSIYDRGDQEVVARAALRDIRVGHQKLRPSDLLSFISLFKSRGLDPDTALEHAKSDQEQLAAMAYARYRRQLKSSGAMDFDDLLLLTEELFTDSPEARFAEASRFDHLLIDEYQDTNGLQYRIVKALASRHKNLCVVGDDDQSIYGWRGAEVSHILGFQRDWQDAKVVRLEDNYRSTEHILKLANTLIQHNTARHQKVLRTERSDGPQPRFIRFDDETKESEILVREIKQLTSAETERRLSPGDIAILFRTNEQPRAFELELRRAKIPYQLVGGMSFYDRREVKDLLAYLKLLTNPNDEVALLRVINTPARGIGQSTVECMLKFAVNTGQPLWSVMEDAVKSPEVSDAAAARVLSFKRMLEHYQGEIQKGDLVEAIKSLVERIDYKSELARLYKTAGDVEARYAAVEETINALALYQERDPEPTLAGFLEEATLAGREDNRDEEGPKLHSLTLMTLHSAKGLEFPHVYLVGMEEGLLPHKRSVADGGANIAEERRLCYVGVTRAQTALTLSFCATRMKWGRPEPCLPSRFLMEMRGETEKARRIAEQSLEQHQRDSLRAARRGEAGKGKKSPSRSRASRAGR